MTKEAKQIVQQDIQDIVYRMGVEAFDFEGKEVLISGACGFLGSWFIGVFAYLNKYVLSKPVTVYAIDSFIAADKENSILDLSEWNDPNIQFMRQDIATMELAGQGGGVGDHVDYIIHAAGIASPVYYRKYPVETIDGMVLGLSNLLKFAAKKPVTSFLNFSSSEIYGNPRPENVPTPEEYYGNVSCIGPRSCYDESKRMGEAMCIAYHRIHNVPVKWVRPFNVYGPGMRRTDDRLVPKFTYQMLTGQEVTVHVPGSQTRTLCYISDAMVGFFRCLLQGKNGEVYNIGSDGPEVSVQTLARLMKRTFAPEAKLTEIEMPTEYPTDQAQRRCPVITKAEKDFGYWPKVTLQEGLKRTWHWCAESLIKEERGDHETVTS